MLKNKNKCGGFTLGELMTVMALWLCAPITVILLLGLWTERNMEFMLTLAKHGQYVDVPYWLAALCSVPIPLAFVFNLVAEVTRLLV